MYTDATRDPAGNWFVCCWECGESIGSMDGETLQRAMWFGLLHGGVKCASCRKVSCPRCYMVTGWEGLCTLCRLELKKHEKLEKPV